MLIRSAEELEGYSRSEEDRLEALIKGIADTGARVVVAGSAIGDMAMHFIEKYDMMAVRIPSKFDLRRFCRYMPCADPPQRLLSCTCGVACCYGRKVHGLQTTLSPHVFQPACKILCLRIPICSMCTMWPWSSTIHAIPKVKC